MEPSARKITDPEEQINLEIEDPALLLQEMLKEQEELQRS